MPKNKIDISRTYLSYFLAFITTVSILVIIYRLLQYFGVETKLNYIDRTQLVGWRYGEFNPKKFLKFFYNLSFFIVPTGTLVFGKLIHKILGKSKRRLSITIPQAVSKLGLSHKKSKQLKIVQKIILHQEKLLIWVLLFVMLFNFGYLLETGIWVNYYHHNFIIGAINDLFAGKHLLVDTYSQYGMLYPFFLYLAFRFGVYFSYMNLYLIFMILTISYFYIFYKFLSSFTKDKLLALSGLFVVISVNSLFNYHTYPVSENYVWPGSIVARYLFDFSVFYLVLKNRQLHNRFLSFVTSLLTSVAFFYNLETGLALLVSYSLFILISTISFQNYSRRQKAKVLFSNIIILILSLGSVFSIFSAYTFFSAGTFPNWQLFFKFVHLAQEGISNVQTPLLGFHLPFIALYFLVIIVVLFKIFIAKSAVAWQWLVGLLIATYGFFLMNYYVSRSVSSNLTVVSIPALTLSFFIYSQIKKNHGSFLSIVKKFIALVFVLTSMIGGYYLYHRLAYRVYAYSEARRAVQQPENRAFVLVAYSEEEPLMAKNLFASITEIKKLTKNQKRILLFSRFDTVILVMSEKTHLLNVPMYEQFYYKSELEGAKSNLIKLKDKPKYMFVDRPDLPIPPSSYQAAHELFVALKPYYAFQKRVGILDVYKLK